MMHTYKVGQILKSEGRRVVVTQLLEFDFLLDDDAYYKIEFMDTKFSMVFREQDLLPLTIDEIVEDEKLLRQVCDCGAWVTSTPKDHFIWCKIYPFMGERK